MSAAVSGPSACVIGNLLTDLILRGVERLPQWGHEVQGANHTVASAGQAGYLSFGLVALGVPASVIGNVGHDDAGSRILRDMSRGGVTVDGIEVSRTGATGISVAVVRLDGERAFVSDFASLVEFDEALVMRHWDLVRRATLVCLVGLFNLPSLDLAAAKRLLAAARAEGKTTVLDTGWDPNGWKPETVEGVKSLLNEVDIFLPNAEEAFALTRKSDGMAAAEALEEHCGGGLVVVKRGGEGSIARRGGQAWVVPALQTKVHDSVGAGDIFNAGFLYGHSRGWEVPVAMAFANAAASIYVSRSQDRFPGASDVLEAAGPYL
jgi:sugar/nucleoside kinase (ribokinase family)